MPKIFALRNSLLEVQQSLLDRDDLSSGGGLGGQKAIRPQSTSSFLLEQFGTCLEVEEEEEERALEVPARPAEVAVAAEEEEQKEEEEEDAEAAEDAQEETRGGKDPDVNEQELLLMFKFRCFVLKIVT